MNYFQDREMSVSWHGCLSTPRKINGGGPQGATLGILEYLSQSNNNADNVNIEDRFKFIDDLTILEVVNLLTVGLSSYNVKAHVPSNVLENNQFIDPKHLKTQENLNNINEWTKKQKMVINQKKTKNVIFNFTKKYQFSTQFEIEGEELETVQEAKLLGTIVTNNLKWDRNTEFIVKKANKRMELLRKIPQSGICPAPCAFHQCASPLCF